MEGLTLDSNVIRDWAWCEERSFETRYESGNQGMKDHLVSLFNLLREARDAGKVEIGITTQVYTDFEVSIGGLPVHIEEMIGPYVQLSGPSISTFPMMFPFVFADADEIDEVLKCVFPGALPTGKKHKNRRKDALQLYAHKIADRDFFITSDKAILSANERLRDTFSIVAVTLEEYLGRLGYRVQN